MKNCCKVSNWSLIVYIVMMWLVVESGSSSPAVPVDNKKCIVWGTGLNSDVVLPARYILIQMVDVNGNNVTDSIGDTPMTVSVSENGERVRVWLRTIDRHDGTYIIQYKLYDSFQKLRIEIRLNNEHIGSSPYLLAGPIYNEKCYCPQTSLDEWISSMECPTNGYEQIEQDLSIFPKVDMEAVEKKVLERFNVRRANSLCHYVVKNNQIYRKTYGEHVGFKMFMDATLLSLTRKVHLPDFEFFVNLGDWPLEKKKLSENPIPIFSWCGSDETRDIVMPTYDVTESTLETMGRVSLDLVSVQGASNPRWENKSSVAFWRGRDSRRERLNLVQMSKENPEIIDAKLTNVFFFKDEVNKEELVKHISFFDFFKYKYQINIDGTVAAYRLPYLLGGDTVVLKQDSPYYEYFYKSMQPFVHYIPFKRDLSDLLQQIQWAKDHDEEAKQISKNAQQFVRENLMAENIFCYHVLLFKEYAKRLTKPPEVREGMELVEQPDNPESQCTCHRLSKNDKDEL